MLGLKKEGEFDISTIHSLSKLTMPAPAYSRHPSSSVGINTFWGDQAAAVAAEAATTVVACDEADDVIVPSDVCGDNVNWSGTSSIMSRLSSSGKTKLTSFNFFVALRSGLLLLSRLPSSIVIAGRFLSAADTGATATIMGARAKRQRREKGRKKPFNVSTH